MMMPHIILLFSYIHYLMMLAPRRQCKQITLYVPSSATLSSDNSLIHGGKKQENIAHRVIVSRKGCYFVETVPRAANLIER